MARLVPKSPEQLLSALEDHMFLLAGSLAGLHTGDAAHLRDLATKLRALVCHSSGLEGLLWRLREELEVDDTLMLRYPGNVDPNHPLARGLYFVCAPVDPHGEGDARVPLEPWALCERIRHHEALFIDGTSITHEELITRLANQTGTAHEADGVAKDIAKINAVLFGDIQPYFAILDADARLTLEVGERILTAATAAGYVRRRPPSQPPARTPLASIRFGNRLEVPSTAAKSEDGSVMFLIDFGKVATAEKEQLPIRLPPMTMSGITISLEVTRRGRLRLTAEGLPLPNFACETTVPDSSQPVAIVLTWRGHDVRAYVAGNQVAGMNDEDHFRAVGQPEAGNR